MNIAPGRAGRLLLALLPFVLIAIIYVVASAERRAVNPDDKLLPPVGEMADAVRRVALQPDRRSGEIVLWADTAASLQRLVLGLGIATLVGLAFGLAIGVLPLVNASLAPLVAVISMIPPMAILPVLFIVFGLGELSKVVLIVIGVAPCLIRDLVVCRQRAPGRADRQGAVARRIHLAGGDPGRAAAGHAAADRCGAAHRSARRSCS